MSSTIVGGSPSFFIIKKWTLSGVLPNMKLKVTRHREAIFTEHTMWMNTALGWFSWLDKPRQWFRDQWCEKSDDVQGFMGRKIKMILNNWESIVLSFLLSKTTEFYSQEGGARVMCKLVFWGPDLDPQHWHAGVMLWHSVFFIITIVVVVVYKSYFKRREKEKNNKNGRALCWRAFQKLLGK